MTSFGFSGLSFRVPMSWIGTALQGSSKKQFTMIRNKIDFYNICEVDTRNIVVILDLIEKLKAEGYTKSVPVLSEVVHYLRSLLLSSDTELVYHTLVLLDHIVKNSGFIFHVMIGRRRFMKTMSYVARKHSADIYYANKRVGNLAVDCIQAWGEAFYPRQEHYPHIYRTYMKLKYKYKMHFPRPDFDATRVPIFLDDITYTEKTMAYSFNNELELNYDCLEECKEEPPEVQMTPSRASQRSIPQLMPPRKYSSNNIDKSIQEDKSDDSPDLIQFSTSSDMISLSELTAPPNDGVPRFVEQYGDSSYTAHRAPSLSLPSAGPGVAFDTNWIQQSPEKAMESVLSLYPPTYTSPPPPAMPHVMLSPPRPPAPSLLTQAAVQPQPQPQPQSQLISSPQPPHQEQRVEKIVTPWDLLDSASAQPTTAGVKCTANALSPTSAGAAGAAGWLSNYMRPTSGVSQTSANPKNSKLSADWDMAGPVDLSKLADSLPVVKEKPPPHRKPPRPQATDSAPKTEAPRVNLTPLTVDTAPAERLPSPRAAVSSDMVAAALRDFEQKMSGEKSLPAYPPPPVPSSTAPPRVPSPPPPTPATVASPPAPLNEWSDVIAPKDKIDLLYSTVALPPLPTVPAPALSPGLSSGSPMVIEDPVREAWPPRDPWSQLSFSLSSPVSSASAGIVLPAPPPVPAMPPPAFLAAPEVPSLPDSSKNGPEESERVNTSSSEEDPILNLIQSMGSPAYPSTAAASPRINALNSPSKVPRIPAPAPGPVRTKRSDNAPPLMHFEAKEQQTLPRAEKSQQPWVWPELAPVPPPPRTKSTPIRSSDPSPCPPRVQREEDGPLERFDPTAGPKPVQPKKPHEPRKVSFTPPSSDPLNEIKYYGNQRVVVRRI